MGYPQLKMNNQPPAISITSTNLGTCPLTHHICKSHIPRNKAKILLLVSASKFWEGRRKVIAFVCVKSHKLTPGTLFMAGGGHLPGEVRAASTRTPDFDVSPTCLPTAPAACVLWLPELSFPHHRFTQLLSSCHNNSAVRRKREREEGEKEK